MDAFDSEESDASVVVVDPPKKMKTDSDMDISNEKNPILMEADDDAEYAAVIEIDLNEITEPLLACPNDPDDIKPLSEVSNTNIDEVFIGSCMTNIGHFRAAGKL